MEAVDRVGNKRSRAMPGAIAEGWGEGGALHPDYNIGVVAETGLK
jgi:hypothetical protein